MVKSFLLGFLSLFVALLFFSSFKYNGSVQQAFIIDENSINNDFNLENDILKYVNQHRLSIGLPNLKLNNVETSQAIKHSQDMASGRVPFSHDGFHERIKAISNKVGFVYASGENVAYGMMNAKEVVDTWLQSPEHKKNIEGNYSLTGIGVAKDATGVNYFTEIFTR